MLYNIYKNTDDWRNPQIIGYVETSESMLDLYDMLTDVFGEGFFYRKVEL